MKALPLICSITLLASGCVPMMIMKSMDHDHYSQYVQNTNALNTEREKSHLEPVHVMTFDEWRGNGAKTK